mgnify:CR=1 FL=1
MLQKREKRDIPSVTHWVEPVHVVTANPVADKVVLLGADAGLIEIIFLLAALEKTAQLTEKCGRQVLVNDRIIVLSEAVKPEGR